MGRIAADGHGGRMLAAWFDRWAKTSHSQRFGPRQLLEAYASALGSDPTAWDLDALPFVVTAVHNRIDLAREGHCGELRVSLASTDPLYRPLHLIFLFRQSAQPDDLSPHGTAHCVATARRWAHLSSLAEDEMLAEVAASVDRLFTAQAFLAAESVEFVTSPWEWRQWFPVDNPDPTSAEELPIALDNPGMFQTVDIPRLNAPGPDREEFLAFVAAEAAGLDARTVAIPADFTPPSARLNQGVPWQPLSLQGLDTQMLAEYPNLRGNIEIVGCPACHATDAEFVHTLPDRTFSPFYERELDARAEHLLARINGEVREPAPFGPLQDDPALPP
jgi:hypothetical protein